MSHYETMFTRRAVRRYEAEPLPPETLEEILAFVRGTEPLPGQKADFRLLTPEQMGLKLAPHYLAASCEETNEAYASLGYVIEALDLELQGRGLGSLWYGMNLPKDRRPGDAIVLAFGRTSQPARGSEHDFSRLPLTQISDTDSAVARAVRLAPSAVNSQPWFLHFEDRSLTLEYRGRGLLKARLEKKLNKIDLGIAARFAVTALEREGKTIEALRPETDGRKFCLRIDFA